MPLRAHEVLSGGGESDQRVLAPTAHIKAWLRFKQIVPVKEAPPKPEPVSKPAEDPPPAPPKEPKPAAKEPAPKKG